MASGSLVLASLCQDQNFDCTTAWMVQVLLTEKFLLAALKAMNLKRMRDYLLWSMCIVDLSCQLNVVTLEVVLEKEI
jgi:hypothetical protein